MLTHFLAIGPGCWGRARTERGAIKNMQWAGDGQETIYIVWHVHKSASVCGDGSIEWEKGAPAPVKVREVGFRK